MTYKCDYPESADIQRHVRTLVKDMEIFLGVEMPVIYERAMREAYEQGFEDGVQAERLVSEGDL